VSATNVSQFVQPKKHHEQQCVLNNVSSFARALSFLLCGPGNLLFGAVCCRSLFKLPDEASLLSIYKAWGVFRHHFNMIQCCEEHCARFDVFFYQMNVDVQIFSLGFIFLDK